MKKSSKKKSVKGDSGKYAKYNTKRVRLCEFSVTEEQSLIIKPALERIAEHHGGKVAAISAAIRAEDKRLKRQKHKD